MIKEHVIILIIFLDDSQLIDQLVLLYLMFKSRYIFLALAKGVGIKYL
jgi:hypothetical protein